MKEYISAKLEIIAFDTEDVITTSDGFTQGNGNVNPNDFTGEGTEY